MSFFGQHGQTDPPRTTGLVPMRPTHEDSSIVFSPPPRVFGFSPTGPPGRPVFPAPPSRPGPADRSACQTATECALLILAELTIGIGCSRRAPTSIPCSVSALLLRAPDWRRLTSCCPKSTTPQTTTLFWRPTPPPPSVWFTHLGRCH